MSISKDTTLVEFIKTNYPAKIWFKIVLLLGLLLGFIYAWSDVISGDWVRVVLRLLITPIILYCLHLISYLIFWVPWFFLMKRWGVKAD